MMLLYLFQGYFGAAAGKAKQAAKTEVEKLKMLDMTCADVVKEAAKMYVITYNCIVYLPMLHYGYNTIGDW